MKNNLQNNWSVSENLLPLFQIRGNIKRLQWKKNGNEFSNTLMEKIQLRGAL
jgi:hypothetical protein